MVVRLTELEEEAAFFLTSKDRTLSTLSKQNLSSIGSPWKSGWIKPAPASPADEPFRLQQRNFDSFLHIIVSETATKSWKKKSLSSVWCQSRVLVLPHRS